MSDGDSERSRRRRRFGFDQPGDLGERREGQEPIGRGRAAVPAPAPAYRARAGLASTDGGRRSPEPPARARLRWRLLALGSGVLCLALVVAACLSPSFRVRDIQVEGRPGWAARRWSRRPGSGPGTRCSPRQLTGDLAAARRPGLGPHLVGGDPAARRRCGSRWTSGEPVAVYTPTGSRRSISRRRARSWARPTPTAAWPWIDGPDAGTSAGHLAIDNRLLRPLVEHRAGPTGVTGQPVNHFQLDRCWNLTMYGASGWPASHVGDVTPPTTRPCRARWRRCGR